MEVSFGEIPHTIAVKTQWVPEESELRRQRQTGKQTGTYKPAYENRFQVKVEELA